jgi:small subunit ribosomal protein S1
MHASIFGQHEGWRTRRLVGGSELTEGRWRSIIGPQIAKREYNKVSDQIQISLATLTPGQRLEGIVKRLSLSGAIIDVGADVEGRLHVSDLGQRQVTRAASILSEGQAVTVWVKSTDLSGGRLSLTMVEPTRFGWPDLQPGLKLEGKVVRLEKFGAFVDIGADTEGLVHISEMSTARVNRPQDVVKEGDVIEVWIKDVDRGSRRIGLTMVEPPELDIRTLKPNMILTGKVVRIESFGAFVDIGAGRDGMIHVTEMGRGYVGSPSEILSVGDVVQVRVVEVDARRGRISLSMKDLPAEQIIAGEEEELPSSLELALREAGAFGELPDIDRRRMTRRDRRQKQRRDREQDDIISRTLRDRPS